MAQRLVSISLRSLHFFRLSDAVVWRAWSLSCGALGDGGQLLGDGMVPQFCKRITFDLRLVSS